MHTTDPLAVNEETSAIRNESKTKLSLKLSFKPSQRYVWFSRGTINWTELLRESKDFLTSNRPYLYMQA